MLIIPAIDLKGGKCVRLWQGNKEQETVYADDPVTVAREWVECGARRLHVVDLDGAFQGKPQHLEVACRIRETSSVPVQYGGGIRSAQVLAQALDSGIDFAIIGTRALSGDFLKLAVSRYGERIIASADFKKDQLAVQGWEAVATFNLEAAALRLTEVGVKTIIMTDIERDGTLAGVSADRISAFARLVPHCQLIVAGGISSIEDIVTLKELRLGNLIAVIAGRALYTGALDLVEAIAMARGDVE